VKAAADLLDRGFADYLVKIRITPDSLRSMVHTDQVDFAASQVLLVDGEPVGAGLISRRGKRCRLSCMCLLPEARGKRLGRELLDQLVAMAAHRGDHEMVLEVIAQNAPAVALYHAAGFETVRELKGYVRPADKQTTNEQVKGSKAISVEAFAAHAAIKETNDVPWQISARTLATASAEQHQAFCIGNDGGVLVNHASSVVRVIRGIVPPADLSELANGLAAVRTTEPQIDWRAPALFPAEWEPAFRAAGFTPTELHQLQLRRPLASSN
jgi:ribosomal protein S18 acetylase RimI-like enzyme